jgi:hypothetical protein
MDDIPNELLFVGGQICRNFFSQIVSSQKKTFQLIVNIFNSYKLFLIFFAKIKMLGCLGRYPMAQKYYLPTSKLFKICPSFAKACLAS